MIETMDYNKIIVIGKMDNLKDHTFELANRVYSSKGVSPTIPVCASDKTPKVLIYEKKSMLSNTNEL